MKAPNDTLQRTVNLPRKSRPGGLVDDVNIAYQVCGFGAGADEVLVSRTIKDVVAGAEVTVTPRGTHALKGIEGNWELYAV